LRLLAGGIFEEEDDTDWVELLEGLWIQRDEFLELNILSAERLDEVCEDSLKMWY
jgi:hypothetical protein